MAQLPVRSKLGHPMRAYYEVMRETGLRPSTLHRLTAPDDYQPGARYLTIREDADKARYGRELPLSARARAALDSACPDRGPIFPKFDGRHTLRKAALAAGLEPERANKVSAYDLRHSLATELTERSGNLVGVGYLLGHKHITTTNHYVHARRKAAESVLSGHRLGHQRVGRLGPPSSGVAQPLEIKRCGREDSCVPGRVRTERTKSVESQHSRGSTQARRAEYTVGERPLEARTPPEGGVQCGREDSNLHECYLTRSLGENEPSGSLNLLEKKGSADVGKRHQTTLSGHGVPAVHSKSVGVEELRRAARALVLRVADGNEVPIEALREFAALTLQCELVQLAQRLQEALPEFAVRRGMELASLVLTWGAQLQTAEGSPPADAPSEDTAGTADLAAREGSTE